MARPRTPTNVLEMRGAFKKDPQRKKAREFEPVDMPPLRDCPEHLGELVKVAWKDIQSRAYWLREADELVVERAAVLLAALRIGQGDGSTEKLFQNYVRMLGMPATERSKVVAAPRKQANPFEAVN